EPKSIVEIGPGGGYFTERLLNITKDIALIEKDDELVKDLKLKFPNLKIFNEDILDFNLNDLNYLAHPTVCFGALPYNISKKIIQIFVQSQLFSDMFFIIQKEVAYDYVNQSGKSSILSTMTNIYADTKLLMVIKPGAFRPQPKVDSALIHIKSHKPVAEGKNILKLEKIIKQAFTNPRKTLRNNLKMYWNEKLDKYQSIRPEDLSLKDYLEISQLIDV
ncbi:MAG TPA: rRNA adenine dimethyltransferase family protein, partial [Candidatus Dojkabacteria bacterium]|nr:rRNA adenine dimethyltransferase family protein [Candidatus Dojkabacteria bacterium]